MGDPVTTSPVRPVVQPVLVWLEIRGFRAFGTEVRRLELDAPLSVVHGRNSQGKSSLSEALEFLISGRSSRRDLFGGAKAEYHESLRNVHLPDGDAAVWVAAGLRDVDGVVHEVRRELVCDFAQGTECMSRLLVDGAVQPDLAAFSLPSTPGSLLRAPVLLQHTLRHVLSTQPKERVAYFKALLSLTDLDTLRDRVARARRRLAAHPPTTAQGVFAALVGTPFGSVADLLQAAPPSNEAAADQLVRDALITAGIKALGRRPDDLDALTGGLKAALEQQREAVFPLAAFTASQTPADPAAVDLTDYSASLARADRETAALAPVFAAVLDAPTITGVNAPVDCPVCATPRALTPERLDALRNELRRSAAVDEVAREATSRLRAAADTARRIQSAAIATVPTAGSWNGSQVQRARQQMVQLGLDDALLTTAGAAAVAVHAAATTVTAAVDDLLAALSADLRTVERRTEIADGHSAASGAVVDALAGLRAARRSSDASTIALHSAVDPVVSTRTASAGLVELLEATRQSQALAVELRRSGARTQADARLANTDKALAAAAATVLDSRFEQMSDSISRWWLTIRPEELVTFAGVQRRAAGTTFVNLMASLRTGTTAPSVERHALGVFSDSQLNALGLSTFLARTELLHTPLVVLDDPIPGSDGDHRLTFVQNTLGALLAAGTQIILTTFDDKLADWAATQHADQERRTFELTLIDHVAGTEVTQTSDVFDQLLLEAEDGLNAPSPKGRRNACNAYRSAAERLAKQIIATGRTDAGDRTSVADVEQQAKMLRDLVPLVRGFALDTAEKGQWSTFAKVLNPGSHDDDVPSRADLAQVRGNLRTIAKAHRVHWPQGLVR